jgi:6-pyruvoyltetrahydropterin/6-carboxytetrahydropterin synthase
MSEAREVVVGRTIEFDMAHRLPFHGGKCRSLHGHRYQVEVSLRGNIISAESCSFEERGRSGMVIDYGDVRSILTALVFEPFDHSVTLHEGDPLVSLIQSIPGQKLNVVPFMPTAEELACFFYTTLSREFLKLGPLICDRVTVRESAETFATCERKI